MTSLLHPLAAVVMMGGVPLAFEVDPAFMMPAASPVMVHAAQAAPSQTGPVEPQETETSPAAQPVEQPAETAQSDAAAETVTPPPVSDTRTLSDAQRQEILQNAASALASAKTAKGRFTQVAPDGSVTHGDFALRRPGRMRFDYDAPTPILIVSDGTTVAMEDSDLETVDRVPLASTPLGIILDDRIDFQTEARVVDIQRGNEDVMITVEDRSGESEGQLSLYFDRATYDLKSWRARDANRQTTLVMLDEVETNVGVDPRLFIMDDPADEEEDER